MERNFRQERDFWLYHLYQPIGARRPDSAGPVSAADAVPVPLPSNLPASLAAVPCLIWKWGLASAKDGYGRMAEGPAHKLAYQQSRGETAAADLLVLHICNRPFCIQPAHLYVGTALNNRADMDAVRREVPTYKTWERLGWHWGRADNAADYYSLPTSPPALQPDLVRTPSLVCPHHFIRDVCTNCGIANISGHWRPCDRKPYANLLWPCRCRETSCYCDFCDWPAARAAGVVPRNIYGQTPPGWRD